MFGANINYGLSRDSVKNGALLPFLQLLQKISVLYELIKWQQ